MKDFFCYMNLFNLNSSKGRATLFWEGIMVPAAYFLVSLLKHDGGKETWVSITICHDILVIKIHSGRDA